MIVEDVQPGACGVGGQTFTDADLINRRHCDLSFVIALLEAYSTTYAAFRRDTGFTPIEQELRFLVISRANVCHYCMAAHSFVADKMSKVPIEVTDAIRDGRVIPDSRLQALAVFTHVMPAMRAAHLDGPEALRRIVAWAHKLIGATQHPVRARYASSATALARQSNATL